MSFESPRQAAESSDETRERLIAPLSDKIRESIDGWKKRSPDDRNRRDPTPIDLDSSLEVLWGEHSEYLQQQLRDSNWRVTYVPKPDFGHDRMPGDVDPPNKLSLTPINRY